MLTAGLFLVGFLLLIKGADLLVTGASSLAAKLGISALVIGLTIVAFGTSAPELAVNLLASWQGSTDIAIGNVVGSNIANIFLILGVAAMIYPLSVQQGTVWREIPFALLAVVVLGVMANDALIDGVGASALVRSEGIVLIGFFLIFLYYIFSITKQSVSKSEDEEIAVVSTGRSVGMILVGLFGLVVGGKWIVDGATTFALQFGVSEALIGLTVVAIGTSLPELATSAVAAYKRNVDIAVGNVVGSNIFNVFWILGISATISPLPFSRALTFDVVVAVVATLILFMALFVGKRHTIERWQGVVLIVAYVAYVTVLLVRG